MNDFYDANGRVKLIVLRNDAEKSMPSLGKLKKEFGAREVRIYKTLGRHYRLISDLVRFLFCAQGTETASDEVSQVLEGRYIYLDSSATLTLASVLRYSERVYKYYDVSYKDYRRADEFVTLLAEIRRGRYSIDSFGNSMKTLQDKLLVNGIQDDIEVFDQHRFNAEFATVGARAVEQVRAALLVQYERLIWKAVSPLHVQAESGSANDEEEFREAA